MSPALFAHPEWLEPLALLALAAVVLLAIARGVARRRRRRLLGPRVAPGAALGDDLALLAALLAVATALVAPRFGERELRVSASGVDVVFALDVSRSMDARDVPPSRLDRARRNLEQMLERLREADRAGLVAFAGRGVLLAPLTPDVQALRELASGLGSDLIRPRSSDLAAGLEAALGAFEAGSERPRVVFVLSDGEDPRRREVEAAEAVRRGVRVLTAALGSEAGATLSDHGTPLVDRAGRVVVSRRDGERLRALAEATGGAFFAGDRFGRIDVERSVASIRRDTGSGPGDTVVRRVRAVQVMPFAALAFALLLVEALPVARLARLARRARVGRLAAPSACAVAALLAAAPLSAPATAQPGAPRGAPREGLRVQPGPRPAPSAAPSELEDALRDRPGDPALLNALGIARLERGRHAAASRAFLAASLAAPAPDTSATALFNLGVAELEAGALEAARDAFFDALALAPGDARARFNLEWTLRALEVQPPPSPGRGEEEETRPEPRETPEDRKRAERPEPPETSPRVPEPLDAEHLARRLERIEDDPGAALRAAARARDGRPRSSAEPEW